jgi:PAS domain S-box-containing protein
MDPANALDENRRLRRTMRDLVALSTLPAVWTGLGPEGVARSLADVLLNTLSLDFVYVRLADLAGSGPIEVVRSKHSASAHSGTVREVLAPLLDAGRSETPCTIPDPFGDGTLRVAVTRFGVGNDHGVLVAGSRNSDFPTEQDRLLLGVGANQTAIVVERRRAEEQVNEQRERLRVTLASIGDAVIATDTEGRVTFMNAVAQELTGWASEDAEGKSLESVFAILNEKTRRPVENPALRALREGVVVGLANHTVLVARDGSERPIDDSAAPMRDERGNPVGAVLVFRDVTERRRAEEALARLAAIVESSDDAIVSKTLDGVIRSWNSGAERIFGYTAEEAVGRPITLIIPPERHDEEPAILERLRCGERVEHFETVRVAKDGRRLDISLTISPICDAEGHVIGASKVARDITERKRAENALRRSERELSEFFENAAVGLHWAGPDGTILRANRTELALLGYTAEEYVGRNIAEFHADPGVIADILRRLAAGEELRGCEARMRCKDGSIREVLLSSNVLWEGGEFVHTRCFTRDITERKHAERALKESEERLAAELDAMSRLHALSTRLVAATDLPSALADVLEEAVRTTGADFGNVQLLNPDSRALEIVAQCGFGAEFLEHFREVRLDEGSCCAQAMEQGERIVIEDVDLDTTFEPHREIAARAGYRGVQSTPLKGRSGEVIGMLSTHYRSPRRPSERDGRLLDLLARHAADLVERFRSEEALRLSEASSRFLAEASAALASVVDYESTLQKVANLAVPHFADWSAVDVVENESLRRLAVAHQDPEKMQLAHELMRRYPPDPESPSGVYSVLRTGKPEIVGDITDEMLVRAAKDAEHLKLIRSVGLKSYICVPLVVSGNTLGALTFATAESGRRLTDTDLALATDLAHRAAVAIENTQLYQALRDADRRKDEFLATLAHELRNPLAPIRNALQIIAMPRVDAATVERSRDMMERQVHQLVRMVDDLLDVSRVMRGKIDLRRERVQLATVVARAVETVQPIIDAQGHRLNVRISSDSLLLDADPVRLVQVVGNLLANAAKYTEPGGRIWLAADRDGDMAVLRVRDSGIGIAPHMLPRIFELFVQVDHASTKAQGGLGIGLTLVKNLVEMHNGIVQARSDGLGHGSEFIVKFPIVEQADDQDHGADTSRLAYQSPPRSGKRLLVVDDNQDAANSLAMLLKLKGHEVRVAYSGMAALEMMKTYTPDVVFLDIGMPGMDGYEVARRIREIPGLAKVVLAALTGWGQQEDRRRTAEASFDHHLVKPPELQAVENILQD